MGEVAVLLISAGVCVLSIWLRLGVSRTKLGSRFSWHWAGGGIHYPWPRSATAAQNVRRQLAIGGIVLVAGILVAAWLSWDHWSEGLAALAGTVRGGSAWR